MSYNILIIYYYIKPNCKPKPMNKSDEFFSIERMVYETRWRPPPKRSKGGAFHSHRGYAKSWGETFH